MGSDVCWNHWTYGDKADRCVAPCSWQGNLVSGGLSTPSPLASWSTLLTSYLKGVSWWTLGPPSASFLTAHQHSRLALL